MNLSISQVLRQQGGTRRRLIDFVQLVAEEQFPRGTRFRRRLRLDTYSHYPKHTQAICKWREQRAGGYERLGLLRLIRTA